MDHRLGTWLLILKIPLPDKEILMSKKTDGKENEWITGKKSILWRCKDSNLESQTKQWKNQTTVELSWGIIASFTKCRAWLWLGFEYPQITIKLKHCALKLETKCRKTASLFSSPVPRCYHKSRPHLNGSCVWERLRENSRVCRQEWKIN